MKVGILGGTFDPIHLGHLLMAESAREILELWQVLFVPAGDPPHKQELPITPKYSWTPCERFSDGQEFIVDETGAMPQGFCPWAWHDLARIVTHLQLNGDFPWYEETGKAIACCTDAVKPTIFLIERLG